MKTKIILILICLSTSIESYSQAASYLDPAQAYNKIILEKGINNFTRVGNFKVKGTPYLFGGNQDAQILELSGIFLKDIIDIKYNTFSQQIEIYSNKTNDYEVRSDVNLDSFFVKVVAPDYNANLKFLSASLFDTKVKGFFLESYKGIKYSLYKRYRSELAYVSTNIVQSDLREFELMYDFYYVQNNSKTLKKIKLNANRLIKEFRNIENISTIINEGSFIFNPDDIVLKILKELNK